MDGRPRVWKVRWGVIKKGKGASIMEYFGALEDPRIDRVQAAPVAGHRRHSHLRRHLWRGLVGLRGDVSARARRNGSAPSWICPTESRLTTPSAMCSPAWNPDRFQECFMEWSQAVGDLLPGEVVAIDGKTVRRSHDNRAGKQPIHLVRPPGLWLRATFLRLPTQFGQWLIRQRPCEH